MLTAGLATGALRGPDCVQANERSPYHVNGLECLGVGRVYKIFLLLNKQVCPIPFTELTMFEFVDVATSHALLRGRH